MTSAEAGTATALPGGCVQPVPPAGAARETRWVLATAALVLATSALFVGWQRQGQAPAVLAAHQVDLAAGLSAAEQGIYTDLQAVHDEWQVLGTPLPPPTPANWADGGWPPFADDLAARQRGSRQWTLHQADGGYAYLGLPAPGTAASAPASAETARAMLWRLPATMPPPGGSPVAVRFDAWLRTAPPAPGQPDLPSALDDASLARHGWRQITAHLHAQYGRAGPPHHHHHAH